MEQPTSMLDATKLEKVLDLNIKFQKQRDASNDLNADNYLIVPAATINQILDDKTAMLLLAVLSLNGNKLNIHFLASDKTGQSVTPKPPGNYGSIKKEHTQLKEKIKNDNKSPLNLSDFPLVIKMGKDDFIRLRQATKCQSYIIFPMIETGWGNPDPKANQDIHLTLGIVASEQNSDEINEQHKSGLPTGESWPEDTFTWFSNPAGGIIIPEY